MLPTTLLTLALGVLASTATAAKPWPKTNIDLTATLTKLAADPTDKDARFGITRNVRAEDFPVEGLDLTKATTLGFHLAGIEDQIMEEITDAADKEKLLKFYRAAHADKAAKLDGMTCTAEQWGKLMQAYDDALYMAEKASPKVVASNKLIRQLFGQDLPAYKPTDKVDLAHIKKIFDNIASNQEQLTFVCPTKTNKGTLCEGGDLAVTLGNTIHWCDGFWSTKPGAQSVPRTAAAAKTSLCKARPSLMFDSLPATMLHELTHAKFNKALSTNDHAYDISQLKNLAHQFIRLNNWRKRMMGINPAAVSLQKKGNILSLKPKDAVENADTYAFFGMMNLRAEFCNIPVIKTREKFGCPAKLGKRATVVKTTTSAVPPIWIDLGLKQDQVLDDGVCDASPTSCGATATKANANVKRATVSGEICCPPKQVSFMKMDPKTKKKVADCKCDRAKGFLTMRNVAKGTTSCKCAKGSISKVGTATCVKCPAKQTSNAAGTACVAAKAPVKKTPVKKTPVKKTRVKKTPVKKTPIKKGGKGLAGLL